MEGITKEMGKMRMKDDRGAKALACALALLLLLMTAACALGEARDVSQACTFSGKPSSSLKYLTDGRYDTSWFSEGGKRAVLEIAVPEGELIGSVYVQFYRTACAFDVQTMDAEGAWQTAASCPTDYLTGYVQLPEGAQRVRIVPQPKNERLHIAQVHVFAQGEAPAWVQRWEAPLEKADLLVIAGHPDDELLFMGGTIPYYAGERRLDVQVAYLVPSMPYRKLELLDGLWLCGVTHYPTLGPFPDRYALSVKDLYGQKGWSEGTLLRFVTGLYRRHRPDVVVSHDVRGEYGHATHRAAADAALRCVELAADAAYQDKRLAYTEAWQVKKLYLHLYAEGEIDMDWRVPLEAFGGKTAFDMAQEAFAHHISQQKTDYRVEDFGDYDCSLFGLAFTCVGEDVEKTDFFEHVE